MTMAIEPADDETFDDVFDRGSREDVKTPEPDTAEKPSQPRDDSGRFASKQEPAPVEQASNDPVPDPALASPDKPPQDREPHHVPLSELKAERKRRQEFEQQLVEARARASAMEQLLQQQQYRAPAPVQQPQEEVPDAFIDPQGYVNHVLGQERGRQREQILNIYEDMTRAKFGDEKVTAAFQAAQAAGIIPRLVQQSNPWSALMSWHQDHVVKQEIGSDFEAYKKRIADDAVAKALEGLKTGESAPKQRFPGSLATATATGTQGAVLSDEAIAADVFGSTRRRKA